MRLQPGHIRGCVRAGLPHAHDWAGGGTGRRVSALLLQRLERQRPDLTGASDPQDRWGLIRSIQRTKNSGFKIENKSIPRRVPTGGVMRTQQMVVDRSPLRRGVAVDTP